MKPKLILLNGNPGMGKSTLARLYADEHPLSLNLDIDRIWFMFGQWQASRPLSDELKYKYAYTLTDMHLASGYDVIVPQLLEDIDKYKSFERIARSQHAVFKEIVLLSTPEDAIERCKRRARAEGYHEGFRPGGVLDTGGREQKLHSMYDNMLATVNNRPNAIRIESIDGDIDGTYATLLDQLRTADDISAE